MVRRFALDTEAHVWWIFAHIFRNIREFCLHCRICQIIVSRQILHRTVSLGNTLLESRRRLEEHVGKLGPQYRAEERGAGEDEENEEQPTGGAALGPELFTFYQAIGVNLKQIYGQTEIVGIAYMHRDGDVRPDTVGKPLPGTECRISEDGEILSRSLSVTPGYYNLPEKTEELLEGGWLHSGDQAEVDADGYYRITGRIKDMIIRGGENIYPREIEEFIFTHPKVALVAVFGVPDSYFGQEVASWIQLKAGEELDAGAVQLILLPGGGVGTHTREVFEDDGVTVELELEVARDGAALGRAEAREVDGRAEAIEGQRALLRRRGAGDAAARPAAARTRPRPRSRPAGGGRASPRGS